MIILHVREGPVPGLYATPEGELWFAPNRRRKTWLQAAQRVREGGSDYAYVKVWHRGLKKHVHWAVHRYVCWTWFGPPAQQWLIVRHLDSDCSNNAVHNLRWGTREQNDDDRVDNARRRGR